MSHTRIVMSLMAGALSGMAAPNVELLPVTETAGYIARLLINETPFPGERGYVSEEDSKATMRALLLVIDARCNRIPPGFTRKEIADTGSSDVLDVITAGGFRGQMDGFYRDSKGRPAMASRVTARIANLARIAGEGEPGRFARLLNYAQAVASDYLAGTPPAPDLFESLASIPPNKVTGRAYGWMTDQDCYHPGGYFVRIPDRLRGRLGGNRFFTLERRTAKAAPQPTPGAPLVTIPE